MIVLAAFAASVMAVVSIVMGARLMDQRTWRRGLVAYRLKFPSGVAPDQVAAWLTSLEPPTAGIFSRWSALAIETYADHTGIRQVRSCPRVRRSPCWPSSARPFRECASSRSPSRLRSSVRRPKRGRSSCGSPTRWHHLAADRAEASVASVLATFNRFGVVSR